MATDCLNKFDEQESIMLVIQVGNILKIHIR